MSEEKFDGFQKYGGDENIEGMLKEHFEKFKVTPLDSVRHFPVFARRVWLKRFLAHYELFMRTVDIPGDIVELGVFRGLGLLSFANFLECRNIGDRTKRVWGFDNFTGFAGLSEKDGPSYDQVNKVDDGYDPSEFFEELKSALAIFEADHFVPWKDRVKLVEGDIQTSVPRFIEENPGLRISFLHFDCDLYEPTKVGLEYLYPRVVRGGVVLFDEYAVLEWGGESNAVEEYFADKEITLKKFPWNALPGAYMIKP